MSTNTIATAPVGGFADSRPTLGGFADARSTPAVKPGKSLFRRIFDAMVASREAEAKRMIARHISLMSEQQRKDLGYPAAGDL